MSDIGSNRVSEAFLAVVGLVGMFFLLGLLFAFPVKWLVNWLFAPGALRTAFGADQIDVWQAWGLNALCAFLFKGATATTRE